MPDMPFFQFGIGCGAGDNEVDGNGHAQLGGRMMDNMTPREAQADVPSTDPPHELLAAIEDLQARLTKLESRDTRGLLGKLFGRGTAAALLIAVLLISGTASARVFHVGKTSCAAWTGATDWRRLAFHSWVAGYMTAYSRWVEDGGPGPVSKSDLTGPWAWIDNYCQENPDKSVSQATEKMILAIGGK